jgi:hypothetical protein
MPGRGRADSRSFIQSEEVTAAHSALLGSTTVDIWMNNASYWRNVPQKV